jgi:hypothetical protein
VTAAKAAPPAGPAAAASDEAAPKLRLPRDTRPVAQAIELAIDPKQDGFSGKVDITIALDRPRSVLWLHGKGLSVKKVTATSGGATTEVAGVWLSAGTEEQWLGAGWSHGTDTEIACSPFSGSTFPRRTSLREAPCEVVEATRRRRTLRLRPGATESATARERRSQD